MTTHPLYRLAVESPEQLEPMLRRAALKMVRRRLYQWARETLRRAVAALGQNGRQSAVR